MSERLSSIRVGFIGAGNMATAMMRKLVAGMHMPSHMIACDIDGARLEALSKELGIRVTNRYDDLIESSDYVILAIKPHVMPEILRDIAVCGKNKRYISIVAGWTIQQLNALVPEGSRCLRVMPNTPAMVGEGVMAISKAHAYTQEEIRDVEAILGSCGIVEWVDDALMDGVTGVSGSGPAYVFRFIDALADGGVREGLSREQALRLAAQTVLGAARMVLDLGKDPAVLKNQVASPGGTTIEALYALEEHGFAYGVMDAVARATSKSKELREKHA